MPSARCVISTILLLSISFASSLHIVPNSIMGTENVAASLTDKQLGIQRYLASLTYLNSNTSSWAGWFADYPDQLDLKSLRYPLAFLTYAAAATAAKTPAYREVAVNIVKNAVERMIQRDIWSYVEHYWSSEPWFPDPVYYENIMYSGHVAQMIALYEAISGDFTYSTKGWDFVWNATVTIHYDTFKLMQALVDQIFSTPSGGIACEPQSIFVICNEHPHAAFMLFDAMHGTTYSHTTSKWLDFLEKNGTTDPEVAETGYLRVTYLRDSGYWVPDANTTAPNGTPVGTVGNDAWTLAWLTAWTPDLDFACKGYQSMRNSPRWRNGTQGGAYLQADEVGINLEFYDFIASTNYPLIESVCTESGQPPKGDCVFEYYENAFGVLVSLDNSSAGYMYKTDPVYSIWATANLLLSMIMTKDLHRSLYHSPMRNDQPYLDHVDYPRVMVRSAFYNQTSKSLHFTVLAERDSLSNSILICENIRALKSISRDGQPWTNYRHHADQVTVVTDLTQNDSTFIVEVY